MTSPLHSKQTITDGIHSAVSFEYTDSTARLAASFTAEDLYKLAYQQSDTTIWLLSDTSPATWVLISSGSIQNDSNASFVVLNATGSLGAERVLSVSGSSGLVMTDAGPGGQLTLAINNNIAATVSGTRFTGPLTGTFGMNFASSSIEAVKTVGFDREYDNGNSGGTMSIDWTRGQKQVMTMTASVTMSFATTFNPKVGNYMLRIVQGFSGGPYTISWPSGSVKWPSGTKPTLSTGSLDIDLISFYFNGSTYFGVGSLDFV